MQNFRISLDVKTLEKILYATILFLVVLFIYSCFGRSINVDDGWLGEPAMWFARDGYIHSAALRGWENAEHHLFFTHKVLVIIGGIFVKVFGYSVYSLKSVSAVYLVLLLASWFYFFKKMGLTKIHFLLFSVLLLLNSLVFEYAYIFRPEIALAFFASWVYFLLRGDDSKANVRGIVSAGLVAGVAIGHHLNGVIIAGAGCLLLLSRKQYRSFLLFGVLASLGFLFYFFDVRSVADFQTMLAQFSNTQDMRGEKTLGHYLFNILDEQRRFLHSPREISITLLAVVSCLLGRRYLGERYKSVLIFAAGMIATLALIAHGKTSKYLILYMPFILLLVTVSVIERWRFNKKSLAVVLFLYAFFQFSQDLSISKNKDNLKSELSAVVGDLPLGSKILAPMEAVFWAWDKYDMQAFEVYEIYNLRGELDYRSPKVFDMLDKHEIRGIILNNYMKDNFDVQGGVFGPFSLVRSSPANQLWFFSRK